MQHSTFVIVYAWRTIVREIIIAVDSVYVFTSRSVLSFFLLAIFSLSEQIIEAVPQDV